MCCSPVAYVCKKFDDILVRLNLLIISIAEGFGISVGIIAAAVIIILVALGLILGGLLCYRYRKKQRTNSQYSQLHNG